MTEYRRTSTVTSFVFIFLLCMSCTAGSSRTCGDKDKVWSANLALWRSQNLSNYDMVVERYSDPMYAHVPFLIKVRDGKSVSLQPARENAGLERSDGYEKVATVEEMFDTIKQACERGDSLNIEYDRELGFPRDFGFDTMKSSDSADGYNVEKFTVRKVYE